jgi:hypothetical protein
MIYRTKFRPPSVSTLPDGIGYTLVEIGPDEAHLRPDLPVTRHTFPAFTTNRPLTPEEMDRFGIIIDDRK